jgi:DNA repair exonuclease SbcCD ATPase subunit
MCLEQMFQSVESRLFAFGRRLCRGPLADLRDQVREATDEHEQAFESLKQVQRQLVAARRRLRDHEDQVARLAEKVQSFVYVHDGPRAYESALELDRLRGLIAEDRQELRRLLAKEGRLLEEVRALRRRLRELEDKLKNA